MYIKKSKYVKSKCNCSLSKQYKNLEKLLEVLSDCLVQWKGRERQRREKKSKEKKKEWGKENISFSVFEYEEKQKGKM